MSTVQVAAHGTARSPLPLLGPTAAPSAGLSFCPGVHPKCPLVGLSKPPKQNPLMSNVLCERAGPGKALRARLRSGEGGMCCLAEVMTHAAVLLHLQRPSPRKCLRDECREQHGWPAARSWPRPWGPRQLWPRRGTAGSGWLRLPRRPARNHPPGNRRGRPGTKSPESVSSAGLVPSPFRLCGWGVLGGRRALFRGCVRKYRGLASETDLCSLGLRACVSPLMGDKGFVISGEAERYFNQQIG